MNLLSCRILRWNAGPMTMLRRLSVPAGLLGVTLVLAGCGGPPRAEDAAPSADGETSSPRISGRLAEIADSRAPAAAVHPRNDPPSPASSGVAGETTGGGLLLRGKIVRAGGGPAGGASLALRHYGARTDFRQLPAIRTVDSTSATESGEFELRSAETERLFLEFGAPGCATMTVSVAGESKGSVPSGAAPRVVERNLELLALAPLRGRVIDDAGRGMGEVLVSARPIDSGGYSPDKPRMQHQQTTTSADGGFRLEGTAAGPHFLTCQAEGTVPAGREVVAPADGLELVAAAEGGVVEGAVFALDSREGVAGATVELHVRPSLDPALAGRPQHFAPVTGTRVVSDASGSFRFSLLPPGRYEVTARKDGLFSLPAADPRTAGFGLGERETTSGLAVYLIPSLTVRGRASAEGTNKPVEGVLVSHGQSFGNTETSAVTDAEGRYELRGVPPSSSYGTSLRIVKEGWQLSASRGGGGSNLSVPAQQGRSEITADFTLTRLIGLRGRVTDESGDAVAGAQVMLRGRSEGAITSEDPRKRSDGEGRFAYELRPGARFSVLATAEGFAPYQSEAMEIEDQTKEVAIRLNRGSDLSGIVVGPGGEAVEGADVNASAVQTGSGSTFSLETGQVKSDASGRFTLSRVPAGDVRVSAKKAGFADSKSMTVAAGGSGVGEIRLELRKPNFFAGQVTDRSGKPVAGAGIRWNPRLPGESSSGEVKAGDDGKYRAEGIPEGVFYAIVNARGYQSMSQDPVELGREDVNFRLEGDGSSADRPDKTKPVQITGRVIDWKSRQPLAEFSVVCGDYIVRKTPETPGQFVIESPSGGAELQVDVTAPDCAPRRRVKVRLGKENLIEMGPGGTVAGRVVKGKAGSPLEETAVFLMPPKSYWPEWQKYALERTATGPDGRFAFESVPAGEYDVAILPAGQKEEVRRPISVVNAGAADLGDVVIPGKSALTVKVIRRPDGEGVGDVQVHLTWFKDGSGASGPLHAVRTGADGSWAFSDLPAGTYSVSAPDLHLSRSFKLQEEATEEIVLETGAGSLRGRVTWRGRPAPSRFYLSQAENRISGATEADGSYELLGVAPGKWIVSIIPLEDSWVELRESAEVSEQGVTEKDYPLPGGAVTGTVTDSHGRPVEDASVSMSYKLGENQFGDSFRAGAKTRSDGTFRFRMVRPAAYNLSATTSNGDRGQAENVAVAGEADTPVTIRLGATGGTVIVRLRGEHGAISGSSAVWLYGKPGTGAPQMKAGESPGEYRLAGVPEGEYSARILAEGHVETKAPILVKAGETALLEKTLLRAGQLDWTLLGSDGWPLRGVEVSYKLESGGGEPLNHAGSYTDNDGRLRVQNLLPGPCVMTVTVRDRGKATDAFEIRAGETTALRSKLE